MNFCGGFGNNGLLILVIIIILLTADNNGCGCGCECSRRGRGCGWFLCAYVILREAKNLTPRKVSWILVYVLRLSKKFPPFLSIFSLYF